MLMIRENQFRIVAVAILGSLVASVQCNAASPQTISFNPIPTQTADTNVALTATASSGLPVTFSVDDERVCTVSSSTSFTGYVVVLLDAGICRVTAMQPGNSDYFPARPVRHSFRVWSSPVDGREARRHLLEFIHGISGKLTMAGQHNREAEIGQPNWIQWIDETTGDFPAVWGGDFLYEPPEIANRQNMINFLLSGAQGGAVIDLMYTPCPPTLSEGCWTWQGGVLSTLTDAQWADLTTPGGTLYGIWLQRLDAIAPYMQQVQNAGFPMLLRLIHEMNQSAFWYGGRPGPNGTALLYKITHDYLVHHWGIRNAVWVWDTQDIWDSTTNSYDFAGYDPGRDYWDVMGFDFYDGHGFTTEKYNLVTAYAGDRPVAIGECEQLPTPAQLEAQPRWTYFLGWAELIQQNDTDAQIDATYFAPDVLTENGNNPMPKW
ncbi:MAG: glycosyl hydrolase [Terracidiphilus sp.]